MRVFQSPGLHIKSWCNSPESGAIDQARNLGQLPFAFKHIALMPDTHQGYGMPIGGVLATINTIIPNAVGVDIGCGVVAYKSHIKLQQIEKSQLTKLYDTICGTIPVGFKHHATSIIDESAMPPTSVPYGSNDKVSYLYPVISNENAILQTGTLGGGNHFIEVQVDTDDFIWFMIHSGSRNLGKKVCEYHNRVAKELNKKWSSSVPPSWDLAFLPIDSEEGKCYIREMLYCLEFAKLNRSLLARQVIQCFSEVLGYTSFVESANIHHNYAVMEHHFDNNVMVHRKGATRARLGEIGIIPGSQGTKSYIVKGLGNKDSFESCSHGAGRSMSRAKARENLNLDAIVDAMNAKGIVHGIKEQGDLDEAPDAYKDIDVVMEEQKDLVEIVTELKPILVVKGN